MDGNCGRKIRGCKDRHAIALDDFIRLAQRYVATGRACQIDHDRAPPHAVDRGFVHQHRRAPAGNLCGGDDYVGSLRMLGNQIAPALQSLL